MYPPVTLPHTHLRTLTAPYTDEPHVLSIALPVDYDQSNETYPVLYLLDGHQWFGMVTESVRLHTHFKALHNLIIVGIGYPPEDFWAGFRRRTFDLTPTSNRTEDVSIREIFDLTEPVESGGGPEFLRFLHESVIPLIESEYRANPAERFLGGDSFSGLFALYALFEDPALFAGYLAGSPSLYWDDGWLFTHEAAYAAAHDTLPARLFLAAGEEEEEAPAHMLSNTYRLAGILKTRAYADFEFTITSFPNETHISVIPSNFMRGVRWLLRDPSLRGE